MEGEGEGLGRGRGREGREGGGAKGGEGRGGEGASLLQSSPWTLPSPPSPSSPLRSLWEELCRGRGPRTGRRLWSVLPRKPPNPAPTPPSGCLPWTPAGRLTSTPVTDTQVGPTQHIGVCTPPTHEGRHAETRVSDTRRRTRVARQAPNPVECLGASWGAIGRAP